MSKKKNYNESIDEINTIIEEIDSGDLDIDTLLDKVKRASELIKFCKDKLIKTESELNDIL